LRQGGDNGFGKAIFVAAQLRHLLAAKRSAEMPQKDQHQCLALPKIPQAFFRTVRQPDVGVGSLGFAFFHHHISPCCNKLNPDKPVVAKCKSRFIGELNVDPPPAERFVVSLSEA